MRARGAIDFAEMNKTSDSLLSAIRPVTVREALLRHGNRGPGFDTVRLVAASAVMLHHALNLEIDIVRDDVLFQFSGGYTHLGLLAVAVFFAISGFLVTPGILKTGNVIDYLSRRLVRIMPLLIMVVTITALVIGPILTELTLSEYFSSPTTWSYFINITTSLRLELPGVFNSDGGSEVNSPLWTLRYEWLCYFIVALSCLFLGLKKRAAFAISWAASIFLYPVFYGFTEASASASQLQTLLYLFGYFGAGVVICLYADVLRWSAMMMVVAGCLLLVALYLNVGYFCAPALVSYLAVAFGLMKMPWSQVLSRADLSYGVYLMHSLVLLVLLSFFSFQSALSLFLACLPISFFLAYLSWTFVEKPALAYKHLPAALTRNVIARMPFGSALLSFLQGEVQQRRNG